MNKTIDSKEGGEAKKGTAQSGGGCMDAILHSGQARPTISTAPPASNSTLWAISLV
jgi:hypothetical protein